MICQTHKLLVSPATLPLPQATSVVRRCPHAESAALLTMEESMDGAGDAPLRRLERKYPQQWGVLRQLWLDLRQVKGWTHLEVHEHEGLGVCYLYGTPAEQVVPASATDEKGTTPPVPPQIVVPHRTHQPITMERLVALLTQLTGPTCVEDGQGRARPQLTIGFVSSDSSIVYHRVASGLAAPSTLP